MQIILGSRYAIKSIYYVSKNRFVNFRKYIVFLRKGWMIIAYSRKYSLAVS